MNSYHYGRREFQTSQEENTGLIVTCGVLFLTGLAFYIASKRYQVRPRQMLEAGIYILCFIAAIWASLVHFWNFSRRRKEIWPHPPVHIPLLKDCRYVSNAMAQNAVVGGYTVENQPWYWSDDIRRMQALLLGMSGAGKTTQLINIIGQDLRRIVRGDHRIPIIIIDGKGDRQFRKRLEYEVAAAGRTHQLRILDPSHPKISVRWNPLFITDENYHEHVNFIFESFGLKRDFFKGHQATYLGDLVRVLYYTGKPINIHDVLVMALDESVLEDQIQIAQARLEKLYSPHDQKRLNFEMSVYSLKKSLQEKERIDKIRGLLNELMTFLEDELSLITGPYEELLTLEDVIDQELILYVSLNFSRNSRAVTALGRMLLRNLQLLAGKRYEEDRDDQPFVSVVMDEFSMLAYPDFAEMIQQARGSNIAILFSLQSVAQLEKVSMAFAKDVASAPNTVMLLRCRQDEETVKYFMSSSSLVETKRRTMTVEETGVLDKSVREIGFGGETTVREARARDGEIRNLPIGQFQVLVTNNRVGTEFLHLHVRRPWNCELSTFQPMVLPRGQMPNFYTNGANLRLKDPAAVERRARVRGGARQAR